ncbi:MAG: DUF2797 domain-containing protein [Candidatus Anstonellaceae archaeon]
MKHILSFSSAEEKPFLVLRKDGNIETFSFELNDSLALIFSEETLCIGYKNEEENYKPCVFGHLNVSQCSHCKRLDIANVYTVGDFSFYPHLKEILEKEKYVLYLAQFGEDITKIGLTRRERYLKRWKEQGADFATLICEFEGPSMVYEIEAYLQHKYGFFNAVRGDQKFKRLIFNKKKAYEKISAAKKLILSDPFIKNFSINEEIFDLTTNYPSLHSVKISENIEGEILGAKGQWLFYKNSDKEEFGVNLSKKIGKFLLEEF